MQINPYNFLPNKDYHLDGDIDFSNADLSALFNLKKINSCHTDITINNYEDILILTFSLKVNVTLISSYSLEETPAALSGSYFPL